MSSLFDIGKSGLTSYRQALAVTGQNIANINTDGYKRRGVALEEIPGASSGLSSTGNATGLGVRVDQIRRSFDEFLLNKVRDATAQAGSSASFLESASQLQNLIMPGESNLSTAIGQFFDGLQEVSTNPSSLATRTLALEGARQMANAFTQTANQIQNFKDGLEVRASQQLGEVNTLTNAIAQINLQLSTASGTQPNNALLDSRDAAIDKLSEYLAVHVALDRKGAANTTLGSDSNGPLLIGVDRATELGVSQQADKLGFILAPGAENIPTAQVTAGSLHGFLTAYAVANEVLAEIDALAFKLVSEVNAIHSKGINLDAEVGGALFRNIDIQLDANPTNTGTASADYTVTDYDLLKADRVTFSFNEEEEMWTGRDEAGDVVARGREMISLPGAEIRFIGAPQQFDQFIFNPLAGTAAGMSVVIQRPEDIAAASPLLVSADPGNDSTSIVKISPSTTPQPTTLPPITDIFSNNLSSVAATEFIVGGPVATIPANIENLEILSLAKQSQAQFLLKESDLAALNSLAVSLSSVDSDGSVSTRNVDFDLTFQTVRGFTGKWIDAGDIADLLNLGVIVGTDSTTGAQVNLAEVGGFASGKDGNLNISLAETSFSAASVGTTDGRTVSATVSAAVEDAANIHVFTREGRHISGTALSSDMRAHYQSMMTVENGFHDGALYLDTYLNGAGGAGYLETSVEAVSSGAVNVDVQQGTTLTTTTFDVLEGIDTNEGSVNGLSSVARNAGYRMTVGDLPGIVTSVDIDAPTGEAAATAMAASLRGNAPIASVIGNASTALEGDEVRIDFEGQVYTISLQDGEPVVSGGEASRLTAFFDKNDRLHVVSNGGTISKSSFTLNVNNEHVDNPAAAQRFGLANSDGQFVKTRYSDVDNSILIPSHAAGSNVVEMTFNKDDVYRLKLVFDDVVDSGGTATTDKEIDINNILVSAGNAQTIADAINSAIAGNATDGDGGADLTGVATAVASGNTVTLTIAGTESVRISALGSSVADGDGTVTVNPVTTSVSAVTLDDTSNYRGKAFDIRREGDAIISYALDDGAPPSVSASSSSLAKQRYTLSGLPDEELIVFVGDSGAKRIAMQYDTLPADMVQPHRDTSIRVVDADAGLIEFFDVETGTSLATRTLDSEQMAHALDLEIEFHGELAPDDNFLIADNSLGKGDSRNLEALLDLQQDRRSTTGRGGFQQIFNTSVARLGALVSSGLVKANADEALKGASREAESAYSGVNLDVEASNLIEQQQAYQASARVLSTAREIFETLLQNL